MLLHWYIKTLCGGCIYTYHVVVSHVIIYNPHSASVVPHIGVVIYMLPQVVSSIDNLDSAVHDE